MRLFVRHPSWTTRKNRGGRPRTSIDFSPFLSIMVVLLFIVMFGTTNPMHPRTAPVDMPITQHSTTQLAALREDALVIVITRDGSVRFRNTRIVPEELPDLLREGIRNGANNTVYVKVDARVRYLDVKTVLDQIRLSGLQNITFLTKHPAVSTP
jgi:biopolymer transport protein ExbD